MEFKHYNLQIGTLQALAGKKKPNNSSWNEICGKLGLRSISSPSKLGFDTVVI